MNRPPTVVPERWWPSRASPDERHKKREEAPMVQEIHDRPQRMRLPVVVSRIREGKLVELKRIQSYEMRTRLAP